jgi:hypothetical protein
VEERLRLANKVFAFGADAFKPHSFCEKQVIHAIVRLIPVTSSPRGSYVHHIAVR